MPRFCLALLLCVCGSSIGASADDPSATFLSYTGNDLILENEEAFKSKDDPNIQFISISAAREKGVMPLGAEAEKSKRNR